MSIYWGKRKQCQTDICILNSYCCMGWTSPELFLSIWVFNSFLLTYEEETKYKMVLQKLGFVVHVKLNVWKTIWKMSLNRKCQGKVKSLSVTEIWVKTLRVKPWQNNYNVSRMGRHSYQNKGAWQCCATAENLKYHKRMEVEKYTEEKFWRGYQTQQAEGDAAQMRQMVSLTLTVL